MYMPGCVNCKRSLIKKIPCHEQGIFCWKLEIIPDVVTDTRAKHTAAAQHDNSNDTDDDIAIVIVRRWGFGWGDGHFFRHDFSPFRKLFFWIINDVRQTVPFVCGLPTTTGQALGR